MEEFDINKSYFIDPLSDVMIEHQKEMDRIEEAMEKSMQEKIEREKKSIELQETIVEQNERLIKLQKIEVNFMRNMSEDTSKLANLLKNLEKTNAINGKIIEANMLEIERILENLVKNSDSQNIYELFINEIKRQITEKGVNFGLQLLITGMKVLISNSKNN